MNPRLVKFAVELQTGEQEVKTEQKLEFKDSKFRFFNFLKKAKVTIPVENK